jgi:hypothetical protein
VTYEDLKSFANDHNRDDGALLKTSSVFRRLLRLSAPPLIVNRRAAPILQESRLVEVSRSGGTKEAGRKGSKKKKRAVAGKATATTTSTPRTKINPKTSGDRLTNCSTTPSRTKAPRTRASGSCMSARSPGSSRWGCTS